MHHFLCTLKFQCERRGGNEEQNCAEETDDPASSASSPHHEPWESTSSPTAIAPKPRQPKRHRGHDKANGTEMEEDLERENIASLRGAATNTFSTKDSDDLFGKYVASKMRQITDAVEKMKAERSITAILYAAQERSMFENKPPTEACDPTPQPVYQDFPQHTSHTDTLNTQVKEEDKLFL